jgi:PAS domain S-box-containing protein
LGYVDSKGSAVSLPRMTGALCGALAILLGALVLVGWAVHSTFLIHVAPDLPPMQRSAALSFALSGLALLGIAMSRPRFTFFGSAITATLAGVSLLQFLSGDALRMSPGAALCFIVLATGFVLAEISAPAKRSAMLGVAGLLVAAVGAACGISLIWGSGDAFAMGNFTRMALHTAGGFLLLGLGAVAVALDMSQARLRQPAWAPIGASVFLAAVRIGLLQAFSPKNPTGLSSTLTLLGALFGAVVFGVFVHLALKAHLQREFLRTANRRLEGEMRERRRAEKAAHAANEQLEQRVGERTGAIESANEELRKEIARRERVEEDLRRQKEILQTIFDHVPVILKFVNKEGRVQMVNREWERVLGRSLDELVNQGVDIYQEGYPDPEDRQRILDFAANSTSEWADFRTHVKDGRVIDTTWAVVRLSDGATICIGQDISERKQVEQELRQQKEILQTIFDHIPVMVSFLDQNKRVKLVNREWERTLGWSFDEIVGQNVDIIVTESYPDPEYREQVNDFIRNSAAEWADFKTKVRDGRVIDTTWAVVRLSDGATICIGQDISERKQVEQELRQQTEILQTIFDHIPVMVSFLDQNKRVKLVNQEWERTLGWSFDEIVGQNVDIIVKENYPDPEYREQVNDFVRNSAAEWADFRTKVRDGRVIDTSWAILHLSDGTSIGIGQDISERKQAERELRQQKEILQTIFDHIPVMISFADPMHQLQLVNREWERTLGWSLEEIHSRNIDIVAANYPDAEYRKTVWDFIINSNAKWADLKTTVRDGRVIDASWAMLHLSDGSAIGIGQDISQRKQAERELRQQKEILQTIFDHIPVMVGFVDQKGQAKLVNREWERTLGWSVEEIQSQKIDVIAENYPLLEYRQQVRDFIRRSDGEWADFKTTLRDGRIIDTSWAMLQLSDGTGIGIGQDISERKQAERELRQQKEILQTIFDHIPVMISFGDKDYGLQLVNGEWERTLGWPLEEIRRRNVDILAENYPDPEYRKQVRDFVINSNGEWADFKTTVPGGRVIDTSWSMLHLSDGTTIGIGQDITRRKRAEEALRESEERFRQLAENIHDLFWIKTPDFKRVLYLSPAFQSMSGRSPEQRYQDQDYQPFLDSIVPEDRERMAEIMRRGAEAEFEIEFRILRPDGSVRWIRDRGFPIRDQSGQIYRVAGIANDITERKIAEEALRESEERFRQLTENIREVFWLRSPDLKQLLYVSPMYEKVCGRTRESLYAAGPELVVHPEDRPRVIETMKNHAGREFEVEYRIITSDGEVRWLRDRGFPIRNQCGQIYRIGGVAEDITDRKEAENRLKASSEQLRALSASLQSAREKEATRIARQIHDELGGLLTGLRWELEALEKMLHQTGDAERLKVMRDKLATMVGLTDTTINVVRSIASELRPSILDDLGLMEAIEWQTQQFQTRTGIPCVCDCSLQSIALGEQESTAVFRIVQEALTNILRHAQATQVCVAMKQQGGMFILTVTDNGRGITPAEKLSRKSLGLLGMQERAHLVGGRVEIIGVKGTGTTLRVRVPLAGRELRGAS